MQDCVDAARHPAIFAGFLKESCQAGVHQVRQLNQLGDRHTVILRLRFMILRKGSSKRAKASLSAF